MLDELFPVQFIEGVNENGEIKRREHERVQIDELANIAIGFAPSHTFILNKIDIYLFWSGFSIPVEYKAKLYPDYCNNPAIIVLTEGKLGFDKEGVGHGWRNIDLNQPIVVFAGNNYWLGLESLQVSFALGQAKEGKKVPFIEGKPGNWFSSLDTDYHLMLRLYGRVVPVLS